MNPYISTALKESGDLKSRLASDAGFLTSVEAASEALKKSVAQGGTVYVCGNGGSAADSIHFCEELSARYKRERPGIKAMHFVDPGFITCWANDYDYDSAFKRGVETFCSDKDLLVGISTSGNSDNVAQAVEAAAKIGTRTIALTGKTGGRLAELADFPIVVPCSATERIQEVHITLIHIFCELLETE